jgi:hypothetical protein
MFVGNTGGPKVTALRFDAHGQYVDPASGFGGYGQFPIGYTNSSAPGSSSSTAVGDLEIGGLFVPHLVSHGFAFVFRLGIALPTGSTSFSDALRNDYTYYAFTNAYTFLTRLSDFYLWVPDGISLRSAASALWRSGMFFARVDVGGDVNLSDQDNYTAGKDLRMNVGAGVAFGPVSLTAESTNLYNGRSSVFDSQWLDTGALAVRVRTGPADFYAAVVLPLENESHEPLFVETTFDAAITLGVEGRLK